MTAGLKAGVSVVIPVYNGAGSLDEVLDRTAAVLRRVGRPFEIIVVNDGSEDDSWQRVLDHASREPWVRGIKLMRNYGQHNALLCGVRAARYAVTVTMDDDLQNPPEEIPKLLDKLERGHDVVYGVSRHQQHSLGHVLAARLLKLGLATALGAKNARIAGPFRAFRTHLRGAFAETRSPWVILDVYLTWGTSDFAAVVVPHGPGHEVRYTVRKRLVQALDMVTGFSTFPLKLASVIGFAFTLFGVGVLAYQLSVYFFQGDTVPGFVFLASTIAIFSGAQLFALGILGEYLARMFQRVMDRPPYAVSETTAVEETREEIGASSDRSG
jgi:undecaprenyl-phosphate 4-deoxy-4-formamido-L-arabinose transferase